MGGGVRGEDVGKLLLCDPFEIPAEGLSLGVDEGGGEGRMWGSYCCVIHSRYQQKDCL